MRVKEFDVLVPTDPDVLQRHLGLLAATANHEILIPLTYEAAKNLSDMLARVLMLEAPEMYFPRNIARKLKNGTITLEEVKKTL